MRSTHMLSPFDAADESRGAVPMADSLIVTLRRTRDARVRLLCFPHAGGGASAFRMWSQDLPSPVAVCALQAPGREHRLTEQPLSSLPALVGTLSLMLRDDDDLPTVFFGHSFGGLVAFELLRELRRQGGRQPARLFIASCRAPHLRRRRPPLHQLPDVDLVRAIRGLAGTSDEILEHAELMTLLLPGIRADLRMSETYSYSPEPPLSCPISAFGGCDDAEVTADELGAWAAQTDGRFTLRLFDGNHFFLRRARTRVLEAIVMDLLDD